MALEEKVGIDKEELRIWKENGGKLITFKEILKANKGINHGYVATVEKVRSVRRNRRKGFNGFMDGQGTVPDVPGSGHQSGDDVTRQRRRQSGRTSGTG